MTVSDNRRADVVLVKTAPDEIVQGGWYRMPLLGIGYLAAYLRDQGVAVAIVDAMFDRLSFTETVERVAAYGPRMVALTAMTHEVNRAAEVAAAVRKKLGQVVTVVGGPHATALPKRGLEEFPAFDYLVAGEGEETLYELYRWMREGEQPEDLDRIKGLSYRDGSGAVVQNEGRPWIEDLDKLPMPAWDLYGRGDVYQIYGSRGCPFQCIFCMRVLGDRVRFRSVENVVDEFEIIVEKYNPKQIDFSDETFTMGKKRVFALCDELERRGLHKRVRWFANARVNTVDEEMLRRMKAAGCFRMGFGIESGNQAILERAQKGTTLEQIDKAIRAMKKVGLEQEAFYILGFPGETRDTVMDTIRMAARLNTTTAAFGIMVPYPGTKVAEMAARNEGGYRLLSRDWSDYDKHLGNALELENLTRKELERFQAIAYMWFYLRNFRLIDLTKFAWEKRKAAWRLARKLMPGKSKAEGEGA